MTASYVLDYSHLNQLSSEPDADASTYNWDNQASEKSGCCKAKNLEYQASYESTAKTKKNVLKCSWFLLHDVACNESFNCSKNKSPNDSPVVPSDEISIKYYNSTIMRK